jgi:hypothetical protein
MLPTKFRFIWPSGFRGEDLKKSGNQKQELPMVAMFVNGSGQNEQSLERTFHRCFLPSFTSFGWGVSKEKIKMWKVNGRQTTDTKWWQKLTLPLGRSAKKRVCINHSPTIWKLTKKLDYSGPCFITFQANMTRCSNNCTTYWHVTNIVTGSEMGYNFPPSKNNEWLLLLQTVINMIWLLNGPSLSMMWEGEAQFLM